MCCRFIFFIFVAATIVWAKEIGTKGFQLKYTEIRERTKQNKKQITNSKKNMRA